MYKKKYLLIQMSIENQKRTTIFSCSRIVERCLLLERVAAPVWRNPNKSLASQKRTKQTRGAEGVLIILQDIFCFYRLYRRYSFVFNMIDSHIIYLYINLGILFFDLVNEY